MPPEVDVVPWQSVEDLSAVGLTEQDVECAAWWIGPDGRWAGGDAIARSLTEARGLWTVVGRLMLIWPLSSLSRTIYRWVAENRGRLPGATPACEIDGKTRW